MDQPEVRAATPADRAAVDGLHDELTLQLRPDDVP